MNHHEQRFDPVAEQRHPNAFKTDFDALEWDRRTGLYVLRPAKEAQTSLFDD